MVTMLARNVATYYKTLIIMKDSVHTRLKENYCSKSNLRGKFSVHERLYQAQMARIFNPLYWFVGTKFIACNQFAQGPSKISSFLATIKNQNQRAEVRKKKIYKYS